MGGMLGGQRKELGGPWRPQQPFLRRGFESAENQFLDNPDPLTGQYRSALAGRAGGAPFEQAGEDELTKTLRGDYLYGGPGFNAAYKAASDKIIPQVASNFERFGRHGSGAEMTAATGALGDAFARLYGQERGRQMQAESMIPQMQGVDYRNIGALGMAGDVNRQLLERYMRLVGGDYGKTKIGPMGGVLGSLMGGIEGGAKGFVASGGNPYVTAAGSVAGGIGGF